MKIAVIGTGMVGRALAAALDGLGHEVAIGTRSVEHTLSRTEPDAFGSPPLSQWLRDHPGVTLLSFADAGARSEVIVNATNGAVSLDALAAVGAENLAGKVLLDVALPLDVTQGMPPALTIVNTDSLAEQIQRAFPKARVVKSLNTVTYTVMVNPTLLPGEHSLFIAGNDAEAKQVVRELLTGFGWPAPAIIDLGDITGARGAEMYSRLYFTLTEVLGTYEFNIQLVRPRNT